MFEPTDRLAETALRALAATPEQRQSGLKMLEDMVQVSHPGRAGMIARWDAVDARRGRPQWRRGLLVALVLMSAWVLVGAVHEVWRYERALWSFGFQKSWAFGTLAESREVIAGGLNEGERFLLFGDLSQPLKSGQMQALCVSAPADAANYAAYAFAWRGENQGSLPEDFLATAQRLDPDNAWFTYHAAGTLARDAVQRERQTSAARKAGEAPAWKILDEAKLQEALALLRQAASQKAFVNRQKEFIAARVPLLRQPDQISRVMSAVFLQDYFGMNLDLRTLSDAIAAQAWRLGEAGDADGFRQLLGDADAFMATFVRIPDPTAIEMLLRNFSAATQLRNLAAAARKLQLEEAAGRLERVNGSLTKWLDDRKNLQRDDAVALRSSVWAGSVCRLQNQVKSPPLLPDADLKPGRMAEHLLLARVGSLAVCLLLGVGLLAVALFRFCLPRVALRLAQRINQLLLPVDWAWMLGAGVLLPFGYVTALLRWTPLGGQDWGLKGLGWMVPTADFLALALLLLAVPVLIARWRLQRRAAALTIWRDPSRLGWLAVAAAAAVVPLLGLTALPLTQLNIYLGLKLALLAPLVLVILISLARALAATFSRQFSRAVVALTLIPSYACGMLLLMASMPVYQAAQAGWERCDEMTQLTANGFTRYECEVANQMMKELREQLELDAAPR
ncbi:MAG: hypothetical protein WCK77_09480 [Verrucomicrobiota bacterium]